MPAVLCNPIIFWPYFFSLTNTVRETEHDPDFKRGIVQQGLVSRPPKKQTKIKPASVKQTQPPSAGLALEEILLLVALLFFFLLATYVSADNFNEIVFSVQVRLI